MKCRVIFSLKNKKKDQTLVKLMSHLPPVQSSEKISIKLNEELCSRGTHCLYIRVKKVHNVEKREKNNLTITSKPRAYPHTMKKMQAKFHNNRYKTVRGVVLTKGTNCLYK